MNRAGCRVAVIVAIVDQHGNDPVGGRRIVVAVDENLKKLLIVG